MALDWDTFVEPGAHITESDESLWFLGLRGGSFFETSLFGGRCWCISRFDVDNHPFFNTQSIMKCF